MQTGVKVAEKLALASMSHDPPDVMIKRQIWCHRNISYHQYKKKYCVAQVTILLNIVVETDIYILGFLDE